MPDVQMRPSLRFVQQIAQVERFAGSWERLSLSSALASPERAQAALMEGVSAALALDQTTPAILSLQLKRNSPGSSAANPPLIIERETVLKNGQSVERPPIYPAMHHDLAGFLKAHDLIIPLDDELLSLSSLFQLYSQSVPAAELPGFRKFSAQFMTAEDVPVFPAVSSFLIESRLKDLLNWTQSELDSGVFHPLAVIGTFHLLFLQIFPFATANHRFCQLLTWRLLVENGYSFVRFRHFAPLLLDEKEQYFNALRQAEKTAGSNWSTLNVWLEFFLEVLLEAGEALYQQSERDVRKARLSRVQNDILSVVRRHGSVSRERIVQETGINLSTVKYNLSVLADRGHLKRNGGGRTTSYTPV